MSCRMFVNYVEICFKSTESYMADICFLRYKYFEVIWVQLLVINYKIIIYVHRFQFSVLSIFVSISIRRKRKTVYEVTVVYILTRFSILIIIRVLRIIRFKMKRNSFALIKRQCSKDALCSYLLLTVLLRT